MPVRIKSRPIDHESSAVIDRRKALLQQDDIPDTTQTIVFDSSGNVQTITHTNNGATVRTDSFTFANNTITEVRALPSGEQLIIVTNTNTLATTITYAAA